MSARAQEAPAPAGEAPAATAAVTAQEPPTKMTRAEARQWRRRARATDPARFRQIIQERSKLEEEVAELATLRSRLATAEEENRRLRTNLEVASAPQPGVEDASRLAFQKRNHPVTEGVVFKVQVGAFRNKDLSKYLDNAPTFSGDTDEDGARKYTLGYFKDYWEADNFKKYLREMGVRDAWIVAYRDGTRVPIRDVLEGAVGMN